MSVLTSSTLKRTPNDVRTSEEIIYNASYFETL